MAKELTNRPQGSDDTPVAWGNVFLGGVTLLACLPAIFGGLGTLGPTFLKPEPRWAVRTAWDRLVVDIYTWSAVLAVVSPPATLVGIGVGIWLIRRVGLGTTYGKAIATIVLLAVVLSALLVIWGLKAMRLYDASGGQSAW